MINILLPYEKKKPFSNVFHLLDPRAQDSTFGVLELHPGGTTASFACFLCQKSLHEKKKTADVFPMSCLKIMLAFKISNFMIYLSMT